MPFPTGRECGSMRTTPGLPRPSVTRHALTRTLNQPASVRARGLITVIGRRLVNRACQWVTSTRRPSTRRPSAPPFKSTEAADVYDFFPADMGAVAPSGPQGEVAEGGDLHQPGRRAGRPARPPPALAIC